MTKKMRKMWFKTHKKKHYTILFALVTHINQYEVWFVCVIAFSSSYFYL